MLYLTGIAFALLIVSGQTLYKIAVDKAGFELTLDFLLSRRLIEMLISWQFLLGLVLFLAATGINFWMYTKYDFSAIQAIAVPVVLAFSFMAGAWLFKDHISALNIAGFLVLVVGVVMATAR